MNTPATDTPLEDRIARRLVQRLEDGSRELPHNLHERLRAARERALSMRRREPLAQPLVVGRGPAVALGASWWTRLAAMVPLVALAGGLVAISILQEDQRASDLAEVDSALLTDELPPAAYTDPGFVQFLRSEAAEPR